MRVATLGGLSGAIRQRVPLRTNGVGAFIEAIVPLSPSSFRGLGHVPGNTIGDALSYLNEITNRYRIARPEMVAGFNKRVNDLKAAFSLDDAPSSSPMTSELRSQIAKLDNAVYFATGQWYKVPWLWWAVGSTLVIGLGAWWWLR